MTKISITLFSSALPVVKIKVPKAAAEAGFFLVISSLPRNALSSVMSSFTVSVLTELCCAFMTGRTHLLNYCKRLSEVISALPAPSPLTHTVFLI